MKRETKAIEEERPKRRRGFSFKALRYDSLCLLNYLANGGRQTYREMQKATGIPWVRIRRMLEPECWEYRDESIFMRNPGYKSKKYNRDFVYQKDAPDDKKVKINYSLNVGFLLIAREYGYHVEYIAKKDPDKRRGHGENIVFVYINKTYKTNNDVYNNLCVESDMNFEEVEANDSE